MIRAAGAAVWNHPWAWAAAMAAVLTLVPVIDLLASGLFYSPETASWTPRSNVMQFARSGLPPLIIGGLVFVVLLWAAGILLKDRFWGVSGRVTSYLLLTLILGPGLIVESVLKTLSGRARPRDVSIFGGEEAFSPALWIADECERNCSFVSGHAALAFWASAFTFLVAPAYRGPLLAAAIALGFAMGVARMAEGAHFLSDVLYAGLIVVGLNVWLARRFGLEGEKAGGSRGP